MKLRILALTSITLMLAVGPPRAAAGEEMQALVDEARTTVLTFASDPEMEWFRENVSQAQGMLIVPRLVRAGFLFGGAGGSGVLVARDPETGAWSPPAFYTLGSASFGPQIGGQVAQMIFLVMSDRGIDSMLATSFKLGADLEVAAGPTGLGAKAVTADILAFSRTKGLFGGVTVDGTVIKTRDGWNAQYYDRAVRPIDILVEREVSQPGADPLREAVTRLTGSVPVATGSTFSAPEPDDWPATPRPAARPQTNGTTAP